MRVIAAPSRRGRRQLRPRRLARRGRWRTGPRYATCILRAAEMDPDLCSADRDAQRADRAPERSKLLFSVRYASDGSRELGRIRPNRAEALHARHRGAEPARAPSTAAQAFGEAG